MILTKEETNVMRGLAILMIVMHNYCHWMPNCILENEYTWDSKNIWQYIDYFHKGDSHIFLNFFSHYGHYGIALFLLLSGYGLSVKYDNQTLVYKQFIFKHAQKLWKLLIPAYFIYFITGLLKGWRLEPHNFIELCTFAANFDPRHPFICGPWWWFSLSMQFYLLYIFFYYKRNLRFIVFFTGLVFLSQVMITMYCWDDLNNRNSLIGYLHYNFPCNIMPFSLGVLIGRINSKLILSPWLCFGGIVITILGSFSAIIWTFALPFAALSLFVIGYRIYKNNLCTCFWGELGRISAWIFVLHPIIRRIFVSYISVYNDYLVLITYLLTTVFIAYIIDRITKVII